MEKDSRYVVMRKQPGVQMYACYDFFKQPKNLYYCQIDRQKIYRVMNGCW